MQIGNRIQAFEWYHFQRPRVTSNLDFFVYKVVLRLIAVKMEGTDITGIALTMLLYCKSPGSCQGSDPGSNLGKLPESGGNQGEVPVSGLSGEFGSTCVVDSPNTWEATGGHGPGEICVGWRITEGLVVSDD